MVRTTLVLGPLASDAMLVPDQDPVRSEKVLVSGGLEGHVDRLVGLQEKAGAVLFQLGNRLAHVNRVGVVEHHSFTLVVTEDDMTSCTITFVFCHL